MSFEEFMELKDDFDRPVRSRLRRGRRRSGWFDYEALFFAEQFTFALGVCYLRLLSIVKDRMFSLWLPRVIAAFSPLLGCRQIGALAQGGANQTSIECALYNSYVTIILVTVKHAKGNPKQDLDRSGKARARGRLGRRTGRKCGCISKRHGGPLAGSVWINQK